MVQQPSLEPVLTAALFRPLHEQLIDLLRGLPDDAWNARTSAARWRVRDVVAHLLDVDVRRVSIDRDRHFPPQPARPIESHADLVQYLDELNAVWTTAARRISARLLVQLLETVGAELVRVMEATDPSAEATFAVTWAGQKSSPMWLDMAREYTERWHHQDQIREAVGAPPLDAPEWLRPVLAASVLALPRSYAASLAPAGTRVIVQATGAAQMTWTLTRSTAEWRLTATESPDPASRITAPDLVLARLLLHRLTPAEAAALISVEGDTTLAAPLLRARAVMV